MPQTRQAQGIENSKAVQHGDSARIVELQFKFKFKTAILAGKTKFKYKLLSASTTMVELLKTK